ncbi:MAG TPA: hypothetical protein VFP98_05845 [Candidatus Polarisedimenticolia bacterium]|nr:hypothetical protein [Candidatus Polarisedimenticolia bacterium]
MHKPLLVTGCGRSGTRYTATLLGKCGLNVVHEKRMGRHGISSWLFAAESTSVPWGPAPSAYTFEHIVHLVRNPLSAIPSIATFKRSAWDYIGQHISIDPGDPILLRAATYWLQWNRLVEKRTKFRIRIEDMPDAIAAVCDQMDAPVDISRIRSVPSDLNTRRYGKLFDIYEDKCLDVGLVRRNTFLKRLLSKLPPMYDDVTWEELRALDGSLTDRIHEKALEYGYEYGTRKRNAGA